MIAQSDLQVLETPERVNIEAWDRIYDELIRNGTEAVNAPTPEIRRRDFSKICYKLIKQYVEWNDYIHSNNIMQLFKDAVPAGTRPTWFIRYEVIIYGRRTPLYFVDHPDALFDRITETFFRGKENAKAKMIGAVVDLLHYYSVCFLSPQTPEDEQTLFLKHLDHLFDYYSRTNTLYFPEEIRLAFRQLQEYLEAPGKYILPGITTAAVQIWDEDDEDPRVAPPDIPAVDTDSDPLSRLSGKQIIFIGDIKNSLIGYIRNLEKVYGFTADYLADYSKITNTDLRKKLQYSKYDAIVPGPMPHSIKGMGNYSSGLEMIKNEPGFPTVYECITSERLKMTRTSIWKALEQISYNALSQ